MLAENSSEDITRWIAYFQWKGQLQTNSKPPPPEPSDGRAFSRQKKKREREGSLDELKALT